MDRETIYTLPYGHGQLTFRLPDTFEVEVILPNEVEAASDPHALVVDALEHPLGDRSWADFAGIQSVAVAINDKTRPVPHALLLPPLVARLHALGVASAAIKFIIATGTHVPTPQTAFGEVVLDEILAKYAVISHDCDAPDLVDLGTTSRGTPIWMNPHFMAADLRIVVGNIEPHHYAGFSGGVKSASIGLAGRETITANHSLLLDPRADLAQYVDNPVRQDIEEIGQRAEVHFALNVVMNRHKDVVHVFFGEPLAVMGAGIPVVRRMYERPVDAPFDLMLTSPGGYPKDINLYQAHKAVTPAEKVTHEGGRIILVAECVDGVGSAGYAQWMDKGFVSHAAVLEQFKCEAFRIGPHKAFLFARQAVRLDGIWVVSDIADAQIRRLLLHPASLDVALQAVLPHLASGARIGILPYANATIPVLD